MRLTTWLIVVMVVAALAVLICGSAQAAGVELPIGELGGGPAILIPWSSDPTRAALDVGVKVLPIEEPAEIPDITKNALGFVLGTAQKIAANSRLDILFSGVTKEDVDFGASVPLYSNGNVWKLRIGEAYVKGIGGSHLLTADYQPTPPPVNALTGKAELPDHQLQFAAGPGAFMATYTVRFE